MRARGADLACICQAGCSSSSAGRPGWPWRSPSSLPAGAAALAHAQGGGDLRRLPAGGRRPVRRAARPREPRAPGRALLPRRTAAWSSRRTCPRSRCASTRPARTPSRARVVLLPLTETGLDRALRPRHGATSASASSRRGRRARPLAPGRYRVRLHVRGLRGDRARPQGQRAGPDDADRARAQSRRPRRCPTPPGTSSPSPARTATATASAPRATATRTRARTSSPPRACPSSRRWPGRSPSPTTRRTRPATTSSRRAPTATTTSSPTARRARSSSRPSRPCSPASRCATSATRATRPGRTCTSRAWVGGWRVDGTSHPIDPLPLLKSWDVSATPAAARR